VEKTTNWSGGNVEVRAIKESDTTLRFFTRSQGAGAEFTLTAQSAYDLYELGVLTSPAANFQRRLVLRLRYGTLMKVAVRARLTLHQITMMGLYPVQHGQRATFSRGRLILTAPMITWKLREAHR